MSYYYIMIERDRSSPEEIEQTTTPPRTICLYPFTILEQSVSGSYLTTRFTHHCRAQHPRPLLYTWPCADVRPPHTPLASHPFTWPLTVLWIIINQRIMGYLLTANVRGGRWAYSKSVAYNNAAAVPRDFTASSRWVSRSHFDAWRVMERSGIEGWVVKG